VSPFDRLMYVVYFIDSIVPSYVGCVVWANEIRRRVVNREIMKIVFWKFMLVGTLWCLCL